MFKKVLIAEDTDFISSGIKILLKEMGAQIIAHATYCDEAFLKIKKAKLQNEPFNLLISDLSFIENPNPQQLHSGEDLIKKAKQLDVDLKTIAFSVEDKPFRVKELCNTIGVNAYVWKSIHGQKELKRAITSVYKNEFFISEKVAHALKTKESIEITDYDVLLLKNLANGLDQKGISEKLKENQISPSSVSSIEKRLKILKEYFNANNPTQLIAITKDFGLI